MCVCEVVGMADGFGATGKLGYFPDSPVMEEEEQKKGRWMLISKDLILCGCFLVHWGEPAV